MKNKDNKLIYFDEYRKINGIEQYLLHSGTSYDNPVMLFLHCSGFPESLLAYKFQKKWENIFTIVNLDQRGTGKTFTRNRNEVPTIEILLEDIHETVAYLKEKYKKDKIVICGHSLGTLLGSLYISKYPEDVLYYIGIGQVVDFKYGENKAYEKLKSPEVVKNFENYINSDSEDKHYKVKDLRIKRKEKFQETIHSLARIDIYFTEEEKEILIMLNGLNKKQTSIKTMEKMYPKEEIIRVMNKYTSGLKQVIDIRDEESGKKKNR